MWWFIGPQGRRALRPCADCLFRAESYLTIHNFIYQITHNPKLKPQTLFQYKRQGRLLSLNYLKSSFQEFTIFSSFSPLSICFLKFSLPEKCQKVVFHIHIHRGEVSRDFLSHKVCVWTEVLPQMFLPVQIYSCPLYEVALLRRLFLHVF